jgi:hypothetical protein
MAARINGFSLAYTATGAVVLWSGIKGETLSATFRGLLQGHAPATDQEPITAASAQAIVTGSGITGPEDNAAAASQDTGASTATAAKNQAIARLLAAPYGWSAGTQWDDLVSLWNRESGWDNTITNDGQPYNAETVAYGIPQALPAIKMGAAANPPLSSATAQITWGLGYIKDEYGSPSSAWAHEVADGYY